MIHSHNRTQVLYALLLLVGSLWFFGSVFGVSFAILADESGWSLLTETAAAFGIFAVALLVTIGHRRWVREGGLSGYQERLRRKNHYKGSELDDPDEVGYLLQTPEGYFLVQIFKNAPQWPFMAYGRLMSRLPEDGLLESRLQKTFQKIKAANKWQGLEDYPGQKSEVQHLIQMHLLDFSDFKGALRFKALATSP
jgi:hypothetical protein